MPGSFLSIGVVLLDKLGTIVLASGNHPSANLIADNWDGKPFPVGHYKTVCVIPGNFLNEGRYSITVSAVLDVIQYAARIPEVVSFNVHETGVMRKEYFGGWPGLVRPKLVWQTTHMHA